LTSWSGSKKAAIARGLLVSELMLVYMSLTPSTKAFSLRLRLG
jgi:hypothetical protein